MKSILKRRKLNNKGLTLVELIIAITILSIIAVGFYSCFVVVAKTNAKAKIQHKATTLAQNVMENLKAENINSIMQQVMWPVYTTTDGAGNTQVHTNFRLVPTSILGASYSYGTDIGNFGTAAAPYATSTDGGVTSEYNQDLDLYQFYLRNLKMENTTFDALVTIDSSDYMGYATGDQNYNNEEVVQIPAMDANYDAIVANAKEFDAEAFSHFDTLGVYDITKMKRTIIVDITRDVLLSGKVKQEANTTYNYECGTHTWEVPDNFSSFTNFPDYTKDMRNVFIFFNPHYDWPSAGAEKIVVNVPKDMELELYLIKLQPTSNELDLPAYDNMNYEVLVEINTVDDSGTVLPGEPCGVSVRTNLGYQYAAPTVKVNSLSKQAKYYYNGAMVLDTDLASTFDLSSLTNKGVTDKLFDVKVEVFLADPSVTIDDATDFNADNLRATLEGTIRN